MNRSAIILAAGHGTRMKSKKPKVLHEVLGKPMLTWIVDLAHAVDIDDTKIVVGFKHEVVREVLAHAEVDFVYQETQEGTGHAVRLAADAIAELEAKDTVFVSCGDTPLMRAETIRDFIETHEKSGDVMSILVAEVDNPFGYGRIVTEKGSVKAIVEQKDATEEERKIRLINTGTYCFKGDFLKKYLPKLTNNNAQGEFYLTDLVALAVQDQLSVGHFMLADVAESLGVNNRIQLAQANRIMQQRVIERHMENGVSFANPLSCYVEPGVTIGQDCLIEENVHLSGMTSIGEGTLVEAGSRLVNAIVGEDCVIKQSVLWDCTVGNECKIGPFAYLRPSTELKNNVKIGDFVEVKNSIVGDGSKIPHLSYIGDSDVGTEVNVGCGSITCNYDGVNKYRTIIEDRVFIGSNTNLVAPVRISSGAFIGAGSTITRDIDSDVLALTRAPLKKVAGWKKKK